MAFNLADFDILLLDIGESHPPVHRERGKLSELHPGKEELHAMQAGRKFSDVLVLFKRRLDCDVR